MVSEAVSSTEQRWNLQTHPWRTNIRLLFLSAMTVFTITVGIGIFNGLHITTLSQDVLLTHVHAGTLGWITLSVLASCLWLFGEGQVLTERSFYISLFSAISIPLYVGAFLSGNFIARSIFGSVVLAIIIGFFVWIVMRSRQIRLSASDRHGNQRMAFNARYRQIAPPGSNPDCLSLRRWPCIERWLTV